MIDAYVTATKEAIKADNPNEPSELLIDEVIVKLAKYFEAGGYTPSDIYAVENIYFMYDVVKWLASS